MVLWKGAQNLMSPSLSLIKHLIKSMLFEDICQTIWLFFWHKSDTENVTLNVRLHALSSACVMCLSANGIEGSMFCEGTRQIRGAITSFTLVRPFIKLSCLPNWTKEMLWKPRMVGHSVLTLNVHNIFSFLSWFKNRNCYPCLCYKRSLLENHFIHWLHYWYHVFDEW